MNNDELSLFLDAWVEDANKVKGLFLDIRNFLSGFPDVGLEYKGRPGVSHSLRAQKKGSERPLFVLVDIIDDDPTARWLSICFYADLVSDPEQLGDVVPGGLMGEDACCFDLEGPEQGAYMLERLKEAHARA